MRTRHETNGEGEVFTVTIKRNGERVPYDSSRIFTAIQKAFFASHESVSEDIIWKFVRDVEKKILSAGARKVVHIERIQDEVETVLMRSAFSHVAKRYIIYRQKRAEIRLTHTASRQIKAQTAHVKKRNGDSESFNLNKLLSVLRRVSMDLDNGKVPLDPLITEFERNMFDGIASVEIEDAIILSAVSFIEQDPGYDTIASRLMHQKICKEVIGNSVHNREELEQACRKAFVDNIRSGVERGVFSERLLEFDLEALSEHMHLARDEHFTFIGMRTLYDRYFVKHEKRTIETPQAFWLRVAAGLAINEDEKERRTKEFYDIMSTLRYIPSTPTLFHAGLSHPQLSSCYISTVSDDLHNIFKCIGDNAQMAKWSGGIGNDWTPVRATNARIRSTNVDSQGIIPFLKIANDTTLAINRSGKRRGATCAYLETWHLDIESFLDLRRNTGDERRRTHDMNTAHWVPDLFMKRVEERGQWTLFSPDEVPDLHGSYGSVFEKLYEKYEALAEKGVIRQYVKMDAVTLWRKMLTRLFETGHPWITFKDPCNIRSPQDHVGVVRSSNLCTEITLNSDSEETAVCNLGSINLARHVSRDGLNQFLLTDTIKIAMRMLDNVIDINFYPTKESKKSNLRHRPVGLGIMGLQDALFSLRISFSDPSAIDFMDKTMEFISYHAIMGSVELARERGHYETFPGSKWDRGLLPIDTVDVLEKERGQKINVDRITRLNWDTVRKNIKKYRMRNSNTMAIAPTATISNIAGCFPCIEPIYKNIYVKANMSGEFTIVNTFLVNDLKECGLWTPKMLEKLKYYDGNIDYIEEIPHDIKELHKEVFEINPIALMRLTAVRGKWIDQSQSHNVFLKGSSGKRLSDVFFEAWKMGVKTTYYLRTLGASQIEKSTLDAKEYGYTQKRKYKTIREALVSRETSHGTRDKKIESTAVNDNTLCVIGDPDCEACQ